MIPIETSMPCRKINDETSKLNTGLSVPTVEPDRAPTPTKPKIPAEPIKIPRPVPLEPKSPAKRVPYIEPTPRLVPDCALNSLVLPRSTI